MKRLRVLQLAMAGPLYGAERWILALAAHLDPERVDCHVAVIDDLGGAEPPLLAAAGEAGLASHRIACRGRVDFAAARALRRLLAEGDFDIVHSHGYKADVLTLLACRGARVATVATPHGWSEQADWKLLAYEYGDRALFSFFDAVAPLSPELCAGVRRNPFARGKLHYIPNGVDLDEVDAARAAARAQPPLGEGPVIGYCGQLIARKDVGTLLRAFATLEAGRLMLLGEGEDRATLEAEAVALGVADRVTFAGYRPDRLEWIARTDMFVLPSRREGVPRCLMEAMALGVPVVASDIAGNRDIVTGETGRLFDVGDVDGLAEALRATLAMGEEERRAQADRARALIEQGYSARAMARAYEGLFSSLVGNPTSPRA